jgi:glucose-6-phosphate isomerase, archaeal
MKDLQAVSGLDLRLDEGDLTLRFGDGVEHPDGERRRLDDVRASLADPTAAGPDHLYTVYMDIARRQDLPALHDQGLLYGAVVYNHGTIGRELLRSQGHIHSEKPGTGLRHSEVYEFWTGNGFVYLQKECGPDVTRAYLVPVGPGDKVVVPFGWVHLTVNAGPEVLSFGAWCARDNKLEYDELRALGGPAHFFLPDGGIVPNPRYRTVPEPVRVAPSDLPLLDIPYDRPIYTSWRERPSLFDFLPNPERLGDIW